MLINMEPKEVIESEGVRLLKRVEYEFLARQGAFDDEKVELLFGLVVPMPATDHTHGNAVSIIMTAFVRALGDRAKVWSQTSFAASDISMPQPDVFLVPSDVNYWKQHPERAYLVVEVARSSLTRDRKIKTRLYGLADVDEYWIVNHVDGVIEVYRDRLSDGSWRSLTVYQRGESIAPLAFPDVAIAVDDVVPPVGS